MSEEDVVDGLMPLKMWLDKQCLSTLKKVDRMEVRVHDILNVLTEISKRQIGIQKKLRAMDAEIILLKPNSTEKQRAKAEKVLKEGKP